MPNYKVVDAGRLDAAMTATADAIREKTSGTEPIPWNADTGFAEAVAGIPPVTKKLIEIEMDDSWIYIQSMTFHNYTEIPDGFTNDMDSTIREYEMKKIDLRPSPHCARIGVSALYSMEALEELYLPSGLKYIDSGAFYGMESLKTLEFPEGLLDIENDAFSNAKSIETITLPISLQYLGSYAFNGCQSLKTTEIKCANPYISMAFKNCPNLKKIWIRDTCETLSGTPFIGCPDDLVIYVEATSMPPGWDDSFNLTGSSGNIEATVVYGQTTCPW